MDNTMAAWKQRAIFKFVSAQAEERARKARREEEEKEDKRGTLVRWLSSLLEMTPGNLVQQGQWEGEHLVIDGVMFGLHPGAYLPAIYWTCPTCEQHEIWTVDGNNLGNVLQHLGSDEASFWGHECPVPELSDDILPEPGQHIVESGGTLHGVSIDGDEYAAPGHTHPLAEIEPPMEVTLAHNRLDDMSAQLSYHDIRLAHLEAHMFQVERQKRELEHALSVALAGDDIAKVLADAGDKSDAWYEAQS